MGILRLIVEKLQARLQVQKGVRQGHFVVVATEGCEPKKFVVKLGHLHNPEFLRLLKQAEDEFGFCQGGALAIPCQPDELQRVLT